MGIMCKVSIIEYSVHGECEGGKRSMGKGGERNKVEKMNGKKKRKEKNGRAKGKWSKGGLRKVVFVQSVRGRWVKIFWKKKNKEM
jgi:hypothetical protein